MNLNCFLCHDRCYEYCEVLISSFFFKDYSLLSRLDITVMLEKVFYNEKAFYQEKKKGGDSFADINLYIYI